MSFIEKLFGLDARQLKKYLKEADKVLVFDDAMSTLTDDELKAKTPYFRERLKQGGNIRRH